MSKIKRIEHTVGPARRDVPESTIAAQPPAQTPEMEKAKWSELKILILSIRVL